jgi:hypothetical protein
VNTTATTIHNNSNKNSSFANSSGIHQEIDKYKATDMLGIYTLPRESDSRVMMRRSLLDKAVTGRSDISIGLEEMSRMTSERSLGEASQGTGARRRRTLSSDMSLGLDDLGTMSRGEFATPLGGERAAGFTLNCWDRENGIRGCDNFNFTESDQESDLNDEGVEADDYVDGIYTLPNESDSRAATRRSLLLDRNATGRSDMSIGLEEMSRMTSERSLGGVSQALGSRRRLISKLSEMSLGVDDLGMTSRKESVEPIGGGRTAGFSLNCWDRQNGIRGCDNFNFAESDQESILDEQGGEGDDFGSDLEDEDDNTPPAKSPDIRKYEHKPWHFPDRNVRKVRFDTYPETHIIDRVEPEEYPLVFYGVHELQKMVDEYKEEEQQERGTYLASLRLND